MQQEKYAIEKGAKTLIIQGISKDNRIDIFFAKCLHLQEFMPVRFSHKKAQSTSQRRQFKQKQLGDQQNEEKIQRLIEIPLIYFPHFPLKVIIIRQMSSKGRLPFLLLAVFLVMATNGINWQGGGNMNQTVMSKIWTAIDTSLTKTTAPSSTFMNSFTKDLSEALNSQWDPAWNVVVTSSLKGYDTILYGYAFNNHWMWHNGITHPTSPATRQLGIVAWKDYNCQAWKNIANGVPESSAFTADQKGQIATEAEKITQSQLVNDIWGATYGLMTSLVAQSGFSSPQNAYTIIMAQSYSALFYGYVCRVGDNFYFSKVDLGKAIAAASNLGIFYIFQTR